MIIDTLLKRRADEGKPIRVGMIGAGFMARGIANQIVNSVPGMVLSAIANRTPQKALRAYAEAGLEEVSRASSQQQLDSAIHSGAPVITDDPFLLCDSPLLDCIVDATGAVEFGAAVTLRAIEQGKHVVTLNAELDATVGPLLKQKADRAGVILTAADGDQPAVQMNLFRFVRSIGLTPLVCGNIKGLQDRFRTPTTQAGFAAKWGQDAHMVTSFADGTKISFEQAVVANGAGMTISQRGMIGRDHAGHVDELTTAYDIDELKALGGIVDYVVGSKPGPGVYVMATHDDPKQKHYLNLYKLGEGPLYSFYTPYHLCHFEAPLSVAKAVLCNDPVLQPLGAPLVEVVATAKKALSPGDVIDGLGGYSTYGQCETRAATMQQRLLPMGVAEGCVVKRAVAVDQVLTYDDVAVPEGRIIDGLRREMDALYPA